MIPNESTITQVCTKCGTERSLTKFYPHSNYKGKTYYRKECIHCNLTKQKTWRQTPEAKQYVKERTKRLWADLNWRKKRLAYQKKYNSAPEGRARTQKYEKSPRRRILNKISGKRWRERNSEKVKRWHARYQRENRKEISARELERLNRDPDFRMRKNLRRLLLGALEKYTENGKAMSSKKYGINFDAIIQKVGPRPDDGRKWHVDHIRPLASFDLNDSEQVRQAFSPRNLRWLPAEVNMSEGSRWRWKRDKGRDGE